MADLTPKTLADLAVVHHEFFVSYVKAGFTESQAIQLVIAWIQKATDGGADTS